ncbi:unnamed protein product [Urochloa decumbens]|uniref:Uncharacterized protein n=1 Tax=Urochloa decumbens TaxID=240449 RepID=A0ABC9FCT2_9POAL
MEATAMSLAKSVLDGVLSRAGTAVADEVALLIGVPKEVEFIRSELEMMQAFLKVSSSMSSSSKPEAAGRGDNTVRTTWVKQVRDLAYDVEDCLLDFALYADRFSSSRAGSWLPGAVAERRRIAARIRDLKASVEALNQRNQRYHIGDGVQGAQQPPPSALPEHGDRSAELAFQVSGIVGRDGEKDAVIKLLSGINGALRVVSVWGMGGMGKSSLVRMVHNDTNLIAEFDCSAWITVPHPLDSAEVFRKRLRKELGMAPGKDVGEFLQDKRYLVAVDDLHDKEEWETIWQVFQFPNDMNSRIIVTTRREDVARHCAGAGRVAEGRELIYKLKPLGDKESEDLLFQKVYKGSDYTALSLDMKEQASHILKRCRGLPLAISTIGGFLASRPKTSIEWRDLHEHLGAELESDDLSNITKVIVSSYDGLPYHLKSIFLYLSIFPENHEVRRNRLLRRWMAEGYIAKNRDMPVENVGERSYSDLINRSMIQPSKASPGVGDDRCRVHSILLRIILSKSIDENQLLLIEKQSNEIPQSKIRHLVISGWKKRKQKLQNINLSYIRSLTIFGEYPASLISPKLLMLRVLDLEETINLENDDLKHIGELRHLRYLSLRGTKISKLPSSLQNLRYLETLDIQDTQVTQLPSGVAKLEKLRYLLAGINFSKDLLRNMESKKDKNKVSLLSCLCPGESCKVFNLSVRAPQGIEKLQNLHMLGVVHVGNDNGVAGTLKKLTNLTNLRRLGVAGLTEKEGQDMCQSIGELWELKRLEVRSETLTFLAKLDEDEPPVPGVPPPKIPRYLVSLRLCGNLSSLPKWISSLNDLAKVKLLGTQLKQGDIKGLQNLRNLTSLGLWENSYIGDSLYFCTKTFPKLKVLDIDGLDKIKKVTIEEGSMPELEKLWVNKCPSLRDNNSGLSGVKYLRSLNELLFKECGDKEKLMKILQRQISGHPNRPKLLVGRSIVPTSPSTYAGS